MVVTVTVILIGGDGNADGDGDGIITDRIDLHASRERAYVVSPLGRPTANLVPIGREIGGYSSHLRGGAGDVEPGGEGVAVLRVDLGGE